jgi:predicted Zn-dependent peptidase
MKKIVFVLFLIFSSSLFSQEKSKAIDVKEYVLDNGLTVMLSENNESPNVYGVVGVKAGGKNDPKDATGIAHYLEHLLFKGTEELGTIDYKNEKIYLDSISKLYENLSKTNSINKRSLIQSEINRISVKASEYAIPNELDKLLKQIGSTNINAFTNQDYTAYYNSFPPNQIEKWLELYSHRFQNPVFRLFQSELETVYEEKNISMDDPLNGVNEEILKNIFKNHPYGQQSVLGKVEHLKNPSLQKMYKFYNNYYVANNMVLALSGDFDSDKIIPIINKKFKNWKSGKVPEFPNYKENPFNKREFIKKKLTPIKVGALIFRSPKNGDPDKIPFDMAIQTLYNYEETGYLNKITDEGKLMDSDINKIENNDYGATLIYFLPKLIGQKLSVAEDIIVNQIEKLKKGDFSDDYVEALKINAIKETSYKWESNESRVFEMVKAFSQNKKWNEYYDNYETIKKVTKNDIVEIAKTYFNDNYLSFYSKMGSAKKEKLKKPDYKPVILKTKVNSKFSYEFLKLKSSNHKPNFIDFNSDVIRSNLNDKFSILKTKNPFNDIFDLEIKFGVGFYKIPEIMFLSNYLSLIGTKEFLVTQLKEAFHKLGSTYYFSYTNNTFSLNVSGIESNLEEIMKLCEKLIKNLVFKETKISQIIDDFKASKKINREQSVFLAQSLNEFAMLGNNSPRIKELSKKEIKKLNASNLKSVYNEIITYEKTINFVGNTEIDNLKLMLNKYLKHSHQLKPKEAYIIPNRQIPKNNKIYILNKKNSIQSHIVFNIEGSKRLNSSLPISKAFNSYFGNDMSSIVFQEIRELRSLAYATFANYELAPKEGKNNRFFAYIGCQSDKTIESIKAMNDLIRKMPEKPDRIEMIKSSLIETSKSSRPGFRNILQTTEDWIRKGFNSDPNKIYLKDYENLSFNSILNFYKKEIKNKPIIISIVGDFSRININELKKFGKIIKVKKSDIFVN